MELESPVVLVRYQIKQGLSVAVCFHSHWLERRCFDSVGLMIASHI